jgi:hypothetical protein
MQRSGIRACVVILAIAAVAGTASQLQAQELIKSKDGAGVVGYKDTPILPWTEAKFHKHDPDRPQSPVVEPGRPSTQERVGTAPSDAIVLFDGTDLAQWKPNEWKLEDGTVTATKGDLETTQSFGDCQLHVEWQAPNPPQGPQMNRGNSGVFFMKRYEVQICDAYTEKIYPDGMAAAIYGETPPLVNATLPPGKWQTYDIIFTAPVFKDDKLVKRATVTMFHNGLLVHYNTEIMGPCAWREIKPYEPHAAKEPLYLQAHGNPVRFRNIWIRPLDNGQFERKEAPPHQE